MAMVGLLAGRMLRSAAASRRSMSVVAGLQKHSPSQVKQGTLALEMVSSFRHRLRAYSAAGESPEEVAAGRVDAFRKEVSKVFSVDEAQEPNHFDVLPDMDEKDLKGHVACKFGQGYLSRASVPASFPVHGFLFGRCLTRPLLSLIVGRKSEDIVINVFFILDIGARYTYLNSAAMDALGIGDGVPMPTPLSVHGIEMPIFPTPEGPNYKNVNILGTDFLSRWRGTVTFDYPHSTIVLHKDP